MHLILFNTLLTITTDSNNGKTPLFSGKARQTAGCFQEMVHPGGFEPPTARFVAGYSIQLSYGCSVNGGEGGIRTLDAAFDRILP